MFNDYEGQQIRRVGEPVSNCENVEQVNGYWREDQEKQPKRESGSFHMLLKPQVVGHVGFRAS